MMTDEKAGVVLRKFAQADASRLANLADNAAIARFMTDGFPSPYTLAHAERFIENAASHESARIFAIEFRGSLAGGVGLHPQSDISRKNAELGYWVAEEFWGNGVATAAVKLIAEWGFRSLDIVRIFARPFRDNTASRKVLEKCGFSLEAVIRNGFYKQGRFVDEMIFSLRKQ